MFLNASNAENYIELFQTAGNSIHLQVNAHPIDDNHWTKLASYEHHFKILIVITNDSNHLDMILKS